VAGNNYPVLNKTGNKKCQPFGEKERLSPGSRFTLIPPWGEAVKKFNGEDEEEGRRFMEGGRMILPPIRKPVYFLKIALGIMAWIPLFPSTFGLSANRPPGSDRE